MVKWVSPMNTQKPKLPAKNYCFGCGPDNPDSMRLKFTYDEAADRCSCNFRLGKRYTGPPGYCHGGIIALILDEAMAKLNKPRQIRAATAQMTVDYLRPVPLGKALRVESQELRVQGRQHFRSAEIRNDRGEVLARGQGVFIALNSHHEFTRASG
jgi:uncharacterized protein (TIGR00369 family)